MLEWWQIAYAALLSGIAAAAAVRFVLRDRRGAVIVTAAAAGLLGPLAWNLILHHTGGDFFVDAPGYVFPISLQDTAMTSVARESRAADTNVRIASP